MDLSIRSIQDGGILGRERVLIDVLADTNLGIYILAGGKTHRQGVSSAIVHLIWFPDLEVEEGDMIAAYTKKGHDASIPNSQGYTTHRFYLDRDTALWGNPRSVAVLLELANWDIGRDEQE